MDYLPTDPAILVSSINMLLRDDEFDTFEQVCYNFNRDPHELKAYLQKNGYVYSEEQKQVRPIGFDEVQKASIAKENIETAYCFFHQKLRVYQYSTMDWQRDDIEFAINSYLDTMDANLYATLAKGRNGFLREHSLFGADLADSVSTLEQMLNI